MEVKKKFVILWKPCCNCNHEFHICEMFVTNEYEKPVYVCEDCSRADERIAEQLLTKRRYKH